MVDPPETFRTESRLDTLRVPPQSIEAEQAVLGGLMLAPERLADAQDLLVEGDFYRRDHRLVWRGICELAEKGKPFDAVTLGDWFEANRLAEQIGGSGYLIDLASTTPSAANLRAYAVIVQGKALLRKLIEAGTDVVNWGFDPGGEDPDLVVAKSQARLNGLVTPRGRGGLEPPGPTLRTMFQDMQARWESDEWMTGLSSPFQAMDEITFGMQAGDLIIAAARPGMGKSIYGGDVAVHVAKNHGPAAVYSLEMTRQQMLQRMAASAGKIPHDWLRSPKAYERKFPGMDSDELWSKYNAAIRFLKPLPLFIDDTSGLTVDQIGARARALKRQHPDLCLIVIDHMHIIAIPGKDPTNELGVVSRKLKALAKELNCTVLALCQLSRANRDRADKRPTLTDLRASGAIEQDADEIWFLHREDYYDKKTHLKKVVELINGKARNAPAGDTVYLRNCFDQMRLETWFGSLPERELPEDPGPRTPFRRRPPSGRDAAAGDS